MSTRRDFLSVGLLTSVAGLAPATPLWAKSSAHDAKGLSYRILGRTKLKLTCVGFGCMTTSDASVITRAANLGINYFDTSRGYQHGNNERLVGSALEGKREKIYLSSKTDAHTKEGAMKELDTSLSELRTDHLDVWYLHGKNSPKDMPDELFEAQQMAKEQGKIRFAGVSTHKPEDVVPFLVKKGATDVILSRFNFTMSKETQDALSQAHTAGLGVVAMKVMAGGAHRKQADGQQAPQGATLAALKWVLRNPYVNTTIPGTTDMDQLEENMKAMNQTFGPEDEKLLALHEQFIRPLYCRMCGACDGQCAKGLPVADVLRYYMYADSYGQFELGRDNFKQLPDKLAAVRCGDCDRCTVNCPHEVRVRERLTRAQEIFS